jgi:hypothetical protein
MIYRRAIGDRTHVVADLRDLIAKAALLRSAAGSGSTADCLTSTNCHAAMTPHAHHAARRSRRRQRCHNLEEFVAQILRS